MKSWQDLCQVTKLSMTATHPAGSHDSWFECCSLASRCLASCFEQAPSAAQIWWIPPSSCCWLFCQRLPLGWSPSADSIIHAALISLSALSTVPRKLPGHEALNTCSLSWSCQIDDATIRVYTKHWCCGWWVQQPCRLFDIRQSGWRTDVRLKTSMELVPCCTWTREKRFAVTRGGLWGMGNP